MLVQRIAAAKSARTLISGSTMPITIPTTAAKLFTQSARTAVIAAARRARSGPLVAATILHRKASGRAS